VIKKRLGLSGITVRERLYDHRPSQLPALVSHCDFVWGSYRMRVWDDYIDSGCAFGF
jgi:hypothetical protein